MIFITGNSRSGTTMLGHILNKNKYIFTFNELHFFEQLFESAKLKVPLSEQEGIALLDKLVGIQEEGFLLYSGNIQYKGKATSLYMTINSEKTPANLFKHFVHHYTVDSGKQIGCDQTPRNILYLEEIFDCYAEAKVVCMLRDPRSVLLSQKRKWKRKFLGASNIPLMESIRSFINYHPYTVSKLWLAAAKAISNNRNNTQVYILKYEALVSDPITELMKLCKFLSIDYDESMLDIPHLGSSNKHDYNNVKHGISTLSKSSWKDPKQLTRGEIFICENICRQYMKEFNYDCGHHQKKPYAQILLYALAFPIKMSLSLVMNLKRMKNIKQAILKRI